MSLDEKVPEVTGLTITPPQNLRLPSNRSDMLPTIEDVDSTHSLTPTPTRSASHSNDDRETSPLSPFYSHPTTRHSLEAQKSGGKQNINIYESDLEACLSESKTNMLHTRNASRLAKDCSVWPGQRTLKEQKKAARQQNSCNPMRNLSKRTKFWVKILIGLLVVGLAVGIGVGISKAVGGGVWKSSS
jgi:hypothetical protein